MKIKKLDLNTKETDIYIDEDTELVALYIGKNENKLSNSLKFIHTKPGINSYINIKAVLNDSSEIDLEGDLIIKKNAKDTNTYLKMDVLMLSENAKARVVPSLEITQDEVKAGHGATVGEIDEDQLFYIMSRGLSSELSKQVLVDGFINEVKEKLDKVNE